jgi:hypothetical protein
MYGKVSSRASPAAATSAPPVRRVSNARAWKATNTTAMTAAETA